MTTSHNLSLPHIQPSQAQKHVTHNKGMQIPDVVVQLSVVSATTASPPTAPDQLAVCRRSDQPVHHRTLAQERVTQGSPADVHLQIGQDRPSETPWP